MPPQRAVPALLLLACAAAAPPLPPPLALWALQEPTGAARISSGAAGPYALVDGSAAAPIATVRVPGGAPWGAFAANFTSRPFNDSARLYAPRAAAPRITEGIAGPRAQVTLVTWVSLRRNFSEMLVAGVWDEYGVEGGATGARQYATFLNLAVCKGGNHSYDAGAAGHISPVGGPTPGNRFCTTAACDARPLAPAPAWHCLATTYDDASIRVYVNGSFVANGARNPFPLTGGIWDPARDPGRVGAEFGVGLNRVNSSVGAAPTWSNRFEGLLGGIAVWDAALSPGDVARACALAPGFAM